MNTISRSIGMALQHIRICAPEPVVDKALEDALSALAHQDAIAWATHHDEPMLFPTRAEAAMHCDDDEEPIALYPAPLASEGFSAHDMTSAAAGGFRAGKSSPAEKQVGEVQGDAVSALPNKWREQAEEVDLGDAIGVTHHWKLKDCADELEAALAARQPGAQEPVDDDAASEAFGEFADDYLTDGNGYAPASTYEACSKAFTAAWPDRVAATAAARAELKRLHGDDRTVGARRAEALNRADARDDAEDDAAPPAQGIDLGQFRKLVMPILCGPLCVRDAENMCRRLHAALIDSQRDAAPGVAP
jgi:hypothetical protein